MRQLGIALQSFHDARKMFPASGWTIVGPGNPTGKYVSWRAVILPYVEQSALGSQYRFDQHWWEGSNPSTGQIATGLFQCPSVPEQLPILQAVAKSPRPSMQFSSPLSRCDYEAMMGVQPTVDPILYSDAQMSRSVIYRNSQTKIADILDGTSNTVVIVECAARPTVYRQRKKVNTLRNDQGYGWIDSESAFSLDGASADGKSQGMGSFVTPRAINATNENEPYSFHSGGANFLFADGHVAFISEQIRLEVAAALSTRAAGEVPQNWE
jgi:prepilin-type processing-associated H-X9-DG protein